MKNVLLWCLMVVHVDKNFVQFFLGFVIDIYEFF
jgi:hypothetical protein